MTPRPLDRLDENICAHCTLLVALLAEVGWIHEMASVRVDCLNPEPGWQRCVVCLMLLHPVRFGRFAGLIPAHASSRLAVCSGTHLDGLPPLPVSAAFKT